MAEGRWNSSPPQTRPSLLLRIRDAGDQAAWDQFVDLYRPLIVAFARKRGLQEADAADLTQVVFQAVAQEANRFEYDPDRGTFRGWLFQVVRNQLHKLQARAQRSPRGTGDTGTHEWLKQQPATPEESAIWEREYEWRLFVWAADKVRCACPDAAWQAFWQTAVEKKSAQDVAQSLGMTTGAVYTAKSRVMHRIKKIIEDVQGNPSLLPESPG